MFNTTVYTSNHKKDNDVFKVVVNVILYTIMITLSLVCWYLLFVWQLHTSIFSPLKVMTVNLTSQVSGNKFKSFGDMSPFSKTIWHSRSPPRLYHPFVDPICSFVTSLLKVARKHTSQPDYLRIFRQLVLELADRLTV